MNWVNIHTDTLRSIEYLGADPVERATWLNLLAWCCSQENGGVIAGALEWGDRKWLQLCGVMKVEVIETSRLFTWKPDGSLVVCFYPKDKEAEVKAKREAGKKGGRPPKNKAKKPCGSTVEKPCGLTELKGSDNGREGKGREWNGIEEEFADAHSGVHEHTGDNSETTISANGEPLPTTKPSMQEIISRVNSLRPEWSKPSAWSFQEQRNLADGIAQQLSELSLDDWKGLSSYLNATDGDPKTCWRPHSRAKFCETFADVYSAYQRWTNNTGTPTHHKTQYVKSL